jgi:hypothetical protein
MYLKNRLADTYPQAYAGPGIIVGWGWGFKVLEDGNIRNFTISKV